MFRIILMCLLTCCSSFMPLKQSESIISEDHTQVVERKTRENYVKTSSGYYEFGNADLFSYDFLVGLVDYYVNDLNQPDLSYNSNNAVTDYVLQTNDVYTVFFYNWSNRVYESVYAVKNIVANKRILDNTDFPVMQFDILFSNGSPYNLQYHIYWTAQRTSDNRLTIWGVDEYVSTDLGNIHPREDWYSLFMLSERIGGFNAFIGNIFQSIHTDPYNEGYNVGYSDGYSAGYDSGESTGYQNGYNVGETNGYQTGFQQGVDDTIASGTEAMTIFSGIMDVAFIPVNVFFLMFDYDVFGINIAGLVSALLTIAVVLIIFRFIAGRKV